MIRNFEILFEGKLGNGKISFGDAISPIEGFFALRRARGWDLKSASQRAIRDLNKELAEMNVSIEDVHVEIKEYRELNIFAVLPALKGFTIY